MSKFAKYEVLTYAVNFGVRPAFSKGPGSFFLIVRIRVRPIKYDVVKFLFAFT